MGFYGSFYDSFIVLICFYRSLCILIDSNWSLWETIDPYAFLWFFMGSYVSLCILMDANWCLCVPIDPYSFLGILMCLYGFL